MTNKQTFTKKLTLLIITFVNVSAALNESLFCDQCTKQYEKCIPCQPICPKTCENPDGRGFCNEQCLEPVKCVCQEGYLRDIASGRCVLPRECPLNLDSSTTEGSSTTESCTSDAMQ